mgnify:CR=1 FL=1
MKVSVDTVKKLMLTDIKDFDNIAVYLENFRPGIGKITITCCNDSWSYYWCAMGEDTSIEKFFLGCDNSYLAGKLSDVPHRITDIDAVIEAAKKEVLRDRRDRRIDETRARLRYEEVRDLDPDNPIDPDVMCDVFGCDWYDGRLPTTVNPKYEYLCKVINAVKAGIKIGMELECNSPL